MAKLYKTVEGDRVDQIVLREYGELKMLKEVVDANPHLSHLPLSLPADTTVALPDVQVLEEKATQIKAGEALW